MERLLEYTINYRGILVLGCADVTIMAEMKKHKVGIGPSEVPSFKVCQKCYRASTEAIRTAEVHHPHCLEFQNKPVFKGRKAVLIDRKLNLTTTLVNLYI